MLAPRRFALRKRVDAYGHRPMSLSTPTGDVVAFFACTGAAFENQLGLLVNGVSTGLVGLNNHTSAIGQSFNLGMSKLKTS
jgi:hypothetical protein